MPEVRTVVSNLVDINVPGAMQVVNNLARRSCSSLDSSGNLVTIPETMMWVGTIGLSASIPSAGTLTLFSYTMAGIDAFPDPDLPFAQVYAAPGVPVTAYIQNAYLIGNSKGEGDSFLTFDAAGAANVRTWAVGVLVPIIR